MTSAPVALVTGVSRSVGIGDAVARRLLADGHVVVATGWPPHDDEQGWSGGEPSALAPERHDLGDPAVPAQLIDQVFEAHGRLDTIVAAHALSSSNGLADVTAVELDRAWAVNVRSVVLLAQAWARRAGERRGGGDPPGGRLVFFTSGQHRGPMDGELAYAVSKGALHQLVLSLDHALSPHGITANCINPGPVDTGYAPPDAQAAVAQRFPDGRWTQPDQTAALVAFVVSDDGALFRGQVLDAEAGFNRIG